VEPGPAESYSAARDASEQYTVRFLFDLSPDGEKACILRKDGRVEIRDLNDSTTVNLGEMPTVQEARFSSDGDRLLICGVQLFEYDARTGDRIRVIPVEGTGTPCYSPDSQRIAVMSGLGYVAIIDAATGEEMLQLDTEADGCSALVFASDGTSLLMRDHHCNSLSLWPGNSETDP
jgi:WD40 repeat protein